MENWKPRNFGLTGPSQPMASEAITCPYCNSYVPAADAAVARARLVCPRCGETFPHRAPPAGPAEENAAAPAETPQGLAGSDAAFGSQQPQRRSSRSVAGIVLGVMAGMASLALAFALVTTHFRRQRDKPPDSSSRPPPVQVVAPADLPALGYLPADTNAILAIHVAEALQQPMGRDLLTRLGFSPVESILETLMARTGFGLEDLDHVVLALQLEQRFVPGGVVVVRTRRPYDAARLRAALDAHPGADRGRKELYRFRLDRPPGDAVLWCATERTLVVGLQPEDLDKVPVIPASGPASLSLPLQKLLKERIGPIGHVWLAGHVERWDRTTVPLALVELPEERAVLTSVRTFAASLQVGPNVTLHAAFDCANEPAAQALEQYLTHRVSDTKAMRELLGDSRPALQKLLGELARTFAVRVQSSWVTAQASATADLMGKVSGAGEK